MLHDVDELMSIGEFSDRCGLSPKRLRNYAAGGLLTPAAVDVATGYRYYAAHQLRDARLIDALREAGIPLTEIRSLLRRPSTRQLDGWARQVTVDAEQRQQALSVARELLELDAVPSTSSKNEKTRNGSMTTMLTAARTTIGRVRDFNEDAVLAEEGLAVVADGMGGHPGGEMAAALAVELVQAGFSGRSVDELRASVRAANMAIWRQAHGTSEFEGMGATVCAAGLTDDGHVAVVHVGDSRAYLVREGALRQLTDDHSVTAELVRRGELRASEALDHPHHGVLTRVLGGGTGVDPDSVIQTVVDGDRFVLCTDGLFNEVPAEEIAALTAAAEDAESAADALVERALVSGGRDNVSVVVAIAGG